LVLNDRTMKTLSIGLKLFATNQEQLQQWAPLMATAVLGVLPALGDFRLRPALRHAGFRPLRDQVAH